jgi:hypothetical protein
MGVDTDLYLPPYVTVRDVGKVVGILLGCSSEIKTFSSGNGIHCVVEGVKVKGFDSDYGLAECASIVIDGDQPREMMYHFEFSTPNDRLHNKGWHGIILRSYSPNIALFVAVIKFFGGAVDFNDCDETNIDFEVAPEDSIWGHDWSSTDNEEWNELQHKMNALRPLSKDDLRAYALDATYA